MLEFAFLIIFPFFMAMAASTDLLTMTISNRLVLGLGASFFVVAPFIGLGWEQIGLHILMALIVLVVFFGFFAAGFIGGGDAKFTAVTALWFGFQFTLEYLLVAALFGGALTVFILFLRRWPLPLTLGKMEWIERLHNQKNGVPYGIALAASGLVVYTQTPFYQVLSKGLV